MIQLSAARAVAWNTQLMDGTRIQVDPYTNKAMVLREGSLATPLWDGVHRLRDGTSITVRAGIMVPNTQMRNLRRGLDREAPDRAPGACQALAEKVCGTHGECTASPSCAPAKQLLQMRREEEQEKAGYGLGAMTVSTLKQCEHALRDGTFFLPCAQGASRSGDNASACARLSAKVCGRKNECADRPACPPTRQLRELESSEQRTAHNAERPTLSTAQCVAALRDESFFAPCQQ